MMADSIAILALLLGLGLVLGVDNVLVIAIFVGRVPEKQRHEARIVGLGMAMVARIIMLAVVLTLATLTRPAGGCRFLCAGSDPFDWGIVSAVQGRA